MIDDIAKLKAELHTLGCHIQAERNDEVRHALTRLRLESERAQALVKMMDAVVALQIAPPVAAPSLVPADTRNGAPINGAVLHKNSKPPGLPSIAKMVVAALEDAAKHGQAGLKSGEITAAVRKLWPEARGVVVSSSAWHLAKTGKLEKVGALYKLNGHAS